MGTIILRLEGIETGGTLVSSYCILVSYPSQSIRETPVSLVIVLLVTYLFDEECVKKGQVRVVERGSRIATGESL